MGADEFGQPIVLKQIDPQTIGVVARAARIPMGIEVAAGELPQKKPVTLTGLRVASALEILQAFDPRYEWREMNGVMVLRTPDAWNARHHPLDLSAPPVAVRNIRASNALSLVAALLGVSEYRDVHFGDTTRFSLNVETGTVMDVLNATVVAHGSMAWSFARAVPGTSPLFPFMVMVHAGRSGAGVGVPGKPPEEPVDVASFADQPAISVGGSSAVLDRIVGRDAYGRPFKVHGAWPSAVTELATATRVPMGIEALGPETARRGVEIAATGRTLREVLNDMVALDPRYEWREMDGVIVVRPVSAWNDSESLLFRLTDAVRLDNVLPHVAIERVTRRLGYPYRLGTIAQGKRISIDVPQGTVLDLLSAILRAHGELTWTLEPQSFFPGYQHVLRFVVMGNAGRGFPVR